MEVIAIVSIIASIGTLLTVFSKTIKKSTCLGLRCETRTPEPSVVIEHKEEQTIHNTSPYNSPQISKKDLIKEIEV